MKEPWLAGEWFGVQARSTQVAWDGLIDGKHLDGHDMGLV